MRRSTLILTLAALLATGGLHAKAAKKKAAAPAKTAPIGAVIEAAQGKVEAKQPGDKFKAGRMGQVLFMGASVRTKDGGKASLRLADGNLVRLAPNSELQVLETAKEGGSLLKLAKGMGRFLVGKLSGKKSFKVQTSNAVAAVKGTDWEGEAGGEGQPDQFRVYESSNPEALEVHDEDSDQSHSIGAGEELIFDGSEFKEEQISDEDRRESTETFQSLPEPEIRPMETGGQGGEGGEGGEQGQGQGQGGQDGGQAQGGEGQGGEGQGGEGQGGESGEGEGGYSEADFEAALMAELEQLYADLELDSLLYNDLRAQDLAAGKVVYDRFGDLVQVDNYIERPYPETIVKTAYSYRDTGDHAGLTWAQETTSYNTALPYDWTVVVNRALNHPDNLDPFNGNYPIYYKIYQDFMAGNPTGDLIDLATYFQYPTWAYGNNVPANLGDPNFLQQGWRQEVWVASAEWGWVNKGTFENTAYNINYSTMGADGPLNNCDYCTGPGGYISEDFSITKGHTGDGGLGLEYTNTDTGLSMFTQTVHVIDDDGNVLGLGAGLGGGIDSFRGLPDSVNLEVNFSAPEFNGRSIDLVFIPSFFDAFEFHQLPDNYTPSTYCGGC